MQYGTGITGNIEGDTLNLQIDLTRKGDVMARKRLVAGTFHGQTVTDGTGRKLFLHVSLTTQPAPRAPKVGRGLTGRRLAARDHMGNWA